MEEANPTKVRNVSGDLKEELRQKLNLLAKKILMKQVPGENNRLVAVSFPNNVLGFGIEEKEQIVQHAHIIFSLKVLINPKWVFSDSNRAEKVS